MTETVGVTFDVDALRRKYAEERARRLRPDGIAQYVEMTGAFARFAEDPWADGKFDREPLTDEVDVAVIGAGFGGLLTGVRLRQLGVESVRLIDRAADVGGTWYWNRYPGIACDVESYVYMPLLEELGYVPTEKYAKGPEIFAHCQRIARHYDLYRDACLHTDVHEIAGTQTNRAGSSAPTGGMRCGPGSCPWPTATRPNPNCPASRVSATFRGHAFHTSRWDYAYTGSTWRIWPTSASASSAPGQRRSSASRTSPGRRSSTSSSARRHRWTCGPTAPRIPSGPAHYAGLAAPPHRELPDPHRRWPSRRRPGRRRLDEHHAEASGDAP